MGLFDFFGLSDFLNRNRQMQDQTRANTPQLLPANVQAQSAGFPTQQEWLQNYITAQREQPALHKVAQRGLLNWLTGADKNAMQAAAIAEGPSEYFKRLSAQPEYETKDAEAAQKQIATQMQLAELSARAGHDVSRNDIQTAAPFLVKQMRAQFPDLFPAGDTQGAPQPAGPAPVPPPGSSLTVAPPGQMSNLQLPNQQPAISPQDAAKNFIQNAPPVTQAQLPPAMAGGGAPAQTGALPRGLPAMAYSPVFDQVGKKYGLDPNLLRAWAFQESTFGKNDVAPDDQGARGMMQITEGWARDHGVKNVHDPVEALDAAARYMRQHLDQGDSTETVLKRYFGGDSGTQWGPKTARYPGDVLDKYRRLTGQDFPGETRVASADGSIGAGPMNAAPGAAPTLGINSAQAAALNAQRAMLQRRAQFAAAFGKPQDAKALYDVAGRGLPKLSTLNAAGQVIEPISAAPLTGTAQQYENQLETMKQEGIRETNRLQEFDRHLPQGLARNAQGQIVDTVSGQTQPDGMTASQFAADTAGAKQKAENDENLKYQTNLLREQLAKDNSKTDHEKQFSFVDGHSGVDGHQMKVSEYDLAKNTPAAKDFIAGPNLHLPDQQKFLADLGTDSDEAQQIENELTMLREALKGTYHGVGGKYVQFINSIAAAAKVGPEFQQYAAKGDIANMIGTTAGARLAHTLSGGRTAMGSQQMFIGVKPSIESPDPASKIRAALAANQRNKDLAAFAPQYLRENWQASKTDVLNAFNKAHPASEYLERAYPPAVPPKDKLVVGKPYTARDGSVVIWNGQGFEDEQ